MIRYDVRIELAEIDRAAAREMILAHHRTLPYSGDFFMPTMQLESRQLEIMVDGESAGLTAADGDSVSLCMINTAVASYDRQILEAVLAETAATQAYAASWDLNHADLFGNFARGLDNQAYQFELLRAEDLRDPVPGLSVEPATEADLAYLDQTDFQPDFREPVAAGNVRVARLGGQEIGIAMLVPHPLNAARVDIGMFTDPDARRRGIGRSILALSADEVLATGRVPVAGCWWRNWASRRVLEAAGLTCIGTIFRYSLDPQRFRGDDTAAPAS
ncbi:MAG TPA: GNAT family N-acetyltransferase [Microlunatus sp.]